MEQTAYNSITVNKRSMPGFRPARCAVVYAGRPSPMRGGGCGLLSRRYLILVFHPRCPKPLGPLAIFSMDHDLSISVTIFPSGLATRIVQSEFCNTPFASTKRRSGRHLKGWLIGPPERLNPQICDVGPDGT